MQPKLPVMIAAIGTSIIVLMWIVMWTLSALFKLPYTAEDAKIAHDMTLFFLALCSALLSWGVLAHLRG